MDMLLSMSCVIEYLLGWISNEGVYISRSSIGDWSYNIKGHVGVGYKNIGYDREDGDITK
jgi:hypothetical protein